MGLLFLEVVLIEIHQTSIDQTSIVQQLQVIDQASFNQTSIIQQLQTIDQTSIQILVLVMPPVFGNQLMDVLAFLLQISLVRQQVEILVFLLLQLRVLDLLWQT